jgi:hypothetical protein
VGADIIMNKNNQNSNNDEISVKELILRLRDTYRYLLSKWRIILFCGLFGAGLGLIYTFLKKPLYVAELSFVLQDDKSASVSGAMGLASQFGIDLSGTNAGDEFSGDNLIELMKSRSIIEKTLLTSVKVNGKQETLAQFYIEFNEYDKKWQNEPGMRNISYPLNANRENFSLKQDSVLAVLQNDIALHHLTVDKLDKKLTITTVTVISTNELFSKYFTENLISSVSESYIQTKTEKAKKNVDVLQRQTDSVRRALNSAITGVASSIDAAPNANPSLQSLHVPSQKRQVDVQANSAILNELVKNLEVSKMSLLQATPLIQIIDRPILPLEKQKIGKLKGIVVAGFISLFLSVLILIVRRIFKAIML